MIKIQELSPEVYYNQSRDFQLLGRLFDTVLNSIKTNADLLYNLPFSEDSDDRLLDLLTLTLGFKSNHEYNVNQLRALCSAFTKVIKNKGNVTAITTAINTLLNAEGIIDEPYVDISADNTQLNLHVPEALKDLNLLYDLLNYILPAGMSCNVIREAAQNKTAETDIVYDDKNSGVELYGDTQLTGRTGTVKADQDFVISVVPNSTQINNIKQLPLEALPGVMSNSTIIMPIAMVPEQSNS